MKKNQFMGWLLIIFALAVLAGMFIDFVDLSKWWQIVDVFVALVWAAGGILFLKIG